MTIPAQLRGAWKHTFVIEGLVDLMSYFPQAFVQFVLAGANVADGLDQKPQAVQGQGDADDE
jgi:hypothetical protein